MGDIVLTAGIRQNLTVTGTNLGDIIALGSGHDTVNGGAGSDVIFVKSAASSALTRRPVPKTRLGPPVCAPTTSSSGKYQRGGRLVSKITRARVLSASTSPPARATLRRLGNPDLSLRVTNLFNVVYTTPTGPPNIQDSIAADGRTFALHLEWRF